MNEITLYIPRWFYPYNLGDSVHSFFAPKIIKKHHKDCKLTVVTVGELKSLLSLNEYVDNVRDPINEELGGYEAWKSYSFSDKKVNSMYSIFAEWHPKLWKYWNDNFDYFYKHPTANILTVNTLLQLGMTQYLFDGTDLHTKVYPKINKENKSLGIVPATKLAGRSSPHPGCDGIGLRFNGDNGESWKAFVKRIKQLDQSIKIIEYSDKNFGFGDEHVPHMNWIDLKDQCARPRVSVMSDGGMHHVFNLVGTDVVLIGAQKINKPYFFKMGNAKFYEKLHDDCISRCYNNIRNLSGWKDLGSICDNSCQKVDPIKLADKVFEDYFK